jgi:uncharacterized protein with ParB-like and HNH nuclease domain
LEARLGRRFTDCERPVPEAGPVRHPTFQRPYIWTQDDQWEPFWEDVQHAADRFLEELDPSVAEESRVAVAEQRAGRHFLGAVVVKQRRTATANVETREVIDGQQRLTTMQLLLNSAHRVADSEGWEDIALELEDLVRNSDATDDAIRIWSSNSGPRRQTRMPSAPS